MNDESWAGSWAKVKHRRPPAGGAKAGNRPAAGAAGLKKRLSGKLFEYQRTREHAVGGVPAHPVIEEGQHLAAHVGGENARHVVLRDGRIADADRASAAGIKA